MAVNGVLRPGFVQMRVMDLDASIIHYRDRIGLEMMGEPENGRAYFRGFDEFDRHSIVLREAKQPGLDVMAFKVRSDGDLNRFADRLTGMGVKVETVPAGEQPGVGRRIRFATPTKHTIDLYAEMDLAREGPMISNPDVWRQEPRGMRATRFDHCALSGVDIDGSAKIFTDALDFEISEHAVDKASNTRLAIFLSCSNKAHDVAFLGHGEDGKLHHTSFLLESWHDVGHAADVIARYEISRDIGPTRHGITRGQTIYFFDPSGNRNETFAGGYQFYPDNPMREWSSDQAGKGIFYYEGRLNDTFLTVLT